MGLPQLAQNATPSALDVPQRAQAFACCALVPHWRQKLAPGWRGEPQLVQFCVICSAFFGLILYLYVMDLLQVLFVTLQNHPGRIFSASRESGENARAVGPI